MNVILTDDESGFDNQNENSNSHEDLSYMAFTFVVKSEHIKND